MLLDFLISFRINKVYIYLFILYDSQLIIFATFEEVVFGKLIILTIYRPKTNPLNEKKINRLKDN